MKLDNWTKYNKMEHNVLLMVQDAKKLWENIILPQKGCGHYYIQGFYYVQMYRAFTAYVINLIS